MALLKSYLAQTVEAAEEETAGLAAVPLVLAKSFDRLFREAMKNEKEPPLSVAPTNQFPGWESKILVMQGRYLRGEAIFHPNDVRPDQAPRSGRVVHHGKNGRDFFGVFRFTAPGGK